MNAEEKRLEESRTRAKHWKRWGTYISERAWGTVREDYSESGAAWEHLPFEHAHQKAYRWNEDGIAGFCDRHQLICFSLALWNEKDQILKERLFGLTGNQGNHGEDVKEQYFYLDATPTHSYQKFLYKYPQSPFPYQQLVEENGKRDKSQAEFELLDTGIFDENKYFDCFVEYAKTGAEDILIRIEIFNRGSEQAAIHILPHLWFRNTWSWSAEAEKPQLKQILDENGIAAIEADGLYFGKRYLYCENADVWLWDEEDGFYYDVLHLPGAGDLPLKVRSMVGLIPLFAVLTIEPEILDKLPNFKRRLNWFIENRSDLTSDVACMRTPGMGERRLLAVAYRERLEKVLKIMLDENEFLSDYGIRSLSKFHHKNPYELPTGGQNNQRIGYEPAESASGFFGGNSNWRGPVWFPVNYLIIESLQKFHHYFGDDLKVESPTGSNNFLNLWEVAAELSKRLSGIFLPDENGVRPSFGGSEKFQTDEHWRDLLLFHEYFDGDTGKGLGASHQTGWTGLVAKLIQQNGE